MSSPASPPISGPNPVTGGEKEIERPRILLAAGLALVWVIFCLLAEFSGALAPLEESLLDWRQSLTAWPRAAPEQVALIAIDQIPPDRPWPWSRLDYALVLRSLLDYAPQSVVFEMNLNERDPMYTAFDATFSHIVARANTVIFSATALPTGETGPLPPNATPLAFVGEPKAPPRFGSLVWPLATFAGNSPVGVNNLQVDGASRLRRAPLVLFVQGRLIPSLALQAATQYLGADLARSEVVFGRAIFLRRKDGHLVRTIPIDDQGRMRIRYRAGPVASWQATFDNVLVYDDQIQHRLPPGGDLRALSKRQVWIGRTGEEVRRRIESPVGRLGRVETQMQIERTILDQDYVRPLPPMILALFFLLVGCAGAPLVVRLGPGPAAWLTLIAALFLIEAAMLVFRVYNVVLPLPALGLLLLGTYLCGLLAEHWNFEAAT